MDRQVGAAILDLRRSSWAVTDRALCVVDLVDELGVFRRDQEPAIGRSLLDLVPELVGCEDVLAALLSGECPRWDLPLVRCPACAGDEVYVMMVDVPYRSTDGTIAGVLHYVEDATPVAARERSVSQRHNELHLLEGQLTRHNQQMAAAITELQRLDTLKSSFVSVAAHELRSPLASIHAYLELLVDGAFDPLTSAQHDAVMVVIGGTRRLLDITEQLLDVTRIEAGRMEIVLQPTDLGALLGEVVAEFRPRVEAKGQLLRLVVADDLPLALCDATRAAQIVGNLVSNAYHYTPQGGRIDVTLTRSTQVGFLEVAVADTGFGIAPEERERLFHRFTRSDSARRTGERGTGLGLHITRSLVELHGGRIWFDSEVNVGTTFHVTFPLADGEEGEHAGVPAG
jgi:signal transduction histidine kinase